MGLDDICLDPTAADRAGLQTPITDRNTPRKLIWPDGIVLASAGGQPL